MNALLDKNAPVKISKVKEPGSDSLLDETESANCLNDYYVSVATKLAAKLPIHNSDPHVTPIAKSFVLHDLISCRRVF